jgi:hypothetical protein
MQATEILAYDEDFRQNLRNIHTCTEKNRTKIELVKG